MRTFARFLVVGGAATALQYLLLVLGVSLGMRPISIVSGGAFVISAVFNFWMSRWFTFRSSAPVVGSGLRFAAMVTVGALLTTVVMEGLLATGLNYIVCQIVTTGVVLLVNFLTASRWVFARGR